MDSIKASEAAFKKAIRIDPNHEAARSSLKKLQAAFRL
jgi:hypothetical protein